MRIALLALVAGLSSTASAADWWLVASNSRSVLYLDRSSIQREGDTVVQQLVVIQPALPIRRIEVTEKIDCKTASAVDVGQTFVLANGQRLEQPGASRPRTLKPGTSGWASYRFACGNDAERAGLGVPVSDAEIEPVAKVAIRASQ